jgi:hypothetical protein
VSFQTGRAHPKSKGGIRKEFIMEHRTMSRFALAAVLAVFSATPALAQNRPGVAAPPNPAGYAIQQQQINNAQQIYNQGQLAIQGSTLAHIQSQQMLSTMSQRNQAQLDAQAPKPLTSPTTTGTLH